MKETIFNIDFNKNIIATAIHSGSNLRDDVQDQVALNNKQRLHEEDPLTDYIAFGFDSSIVQLTSRFEYDINRNPINAVYQSPEDCWGLNIYEKPISSEMITTSLDKYKKFYNKIDAIFNELSHTYKTIFVWDIHSFNNRGRADINNFNADNAVPDICLGTSNANSAFFPLFKEIVENIRTADFFGSNLSVDFNNPFPGGTFPRYLNASFNNKVVALTIEINKRIFMNSREYNFDEDDACVKIQALTRIRDIITSQSPLIESLI